MTSSRSHGTFKSGLIGLGIMLVLVMLVCGCTQPGTNPSWHAISNRYTDYHRNAESGICVIVARLGALLRLKKIYPAMSMACALLRTGLPAKSGRSSAMRAANLRLTVTPTVEGKKMFTLTEADNGKTENITQNTRFAVVLAENPTTGFMWNATLSSGLELQSSDYLQNDAPSGMVGVGGTRTWVIIAKDLGDQKFSAVSKRSWEPETGNETAYNVNIRVGKA